MRLRSIWSMPSYPLSVRLLRTREWAAMEIANRLPLRIRYWVTLQEISRATITSPDIPATPLDDILKNLDAPKYVA